MVGRPGFEQEHARAFVLAQPVREHAAGRARADDDVVVAFAQSSNHHGAGLRLAASEERIVAGHECSTHSRRASARPHRPARYFAQMRCQRSTRFFWPRSPLAEYRGTAAAAGRARHSPPCAMPILDAVSRQDRSGLRVTGGERSSVIALAAFQSPRATASRSAKIAATAPSRPRSTRTPPRQLHEGIELGGVAHHADLAADGLLQPDEGRGVAVAVLHADDLRDLHQRLEALDRQRDVMQRRVVIDEDVELREQLGQSRKNRTALSTVDGK